MSNLLKIKNVHCYNRLEAPKKGISIIEDCNMSLSDFEKIKKLLIGLEIYKRDKESCPFNRGNWVCDQYIGNDIFCIKLPIEMHEEDVKTYFKPLIDIIKSRMN